ncbi:unnamed protein product, partial [Allacma fusca]
MLYSNQRHSKETKPIHFNTRNCHEAFYGREDILEDFHHLVEESKRSGDLITVLCPAFDSNRLGGIGTTETMRSTILKGIYEQLCTEPCLIVFDNTKSLESQEQPNSDIQNFLPLNLP